MPAVSDAAGAGLVEAGRAWVRADERTAGFRAAGLAAVARGASTVTAGNDVWAYEPFTWHARYASFPSGHASTAFAA